MPMTSDPEAREKSLAALQHWKPGQSGNPNGRRSVGISYKAWGNELDSGDEQGVARYDDDALRTIRDDPKQCRAKRGAAADLLDLPRTDYHKAIPMRANATDRLCDRTDGKPHQTMSIQRTDVRPPSAIGVDVDAALGRMLVSDPAMLGRAMASISPADRAKALAALPEAEPTDQP